MFNIKWCVCFTFTFCTKCTLIRSTSKFSLEIDIFWYLDFTKFTIAKVVTYTQVFQTQLKTDTDGIKIWVLKNYTD